MRRFIADTFAVIVFSTLIGLFLELVIAGMTLSQSLQARITSVPVMILTARPYGIFRDWVFKVSGADKAGRVGRAIADIGAFVAFQIPVYAAILLMAGANLNQVVAACASAIIVLVVSGRPYGLFMEFSRPVSCCPDLKQLLSPLFERLQRSCLRLASATHS
jgi:L-alanine exporter